MDKAKRNINLDILRCLAMVGIVAMHICVHGLSSIQNLQSESLRRDEGILTELIIIGVFVIAVNLFFLISGYYGLSFKRKKALSLWLEANEYSTVTYLCAAHIGAEEFTFKHLIENLLWGGVNYWFLVVYLLIYLFSDYYNRIIDSMTDKEIKTFVTVFFAINVLLGFLFENSHYGTPFSVLPMLFIYSCGRALRKCNLKKYQTVKIAMLYFIATFATIGGSYLAILIHKQKLAYRILTSYCSPFVIVASICVFLLFIKMREMCTSDKLQIIITRMSSATFAVYLLTDSISSRKFIYKPLKFLFGINLEGRSYLLPIVIGYAVFLFIICELIDCLRVRVIDNIKKVVYKME